MSTPRSSSVVGIAKDQKVQSGESAESISLFSRNRFSESVGGLKSETIAPFLESHKGNLWKYMLELWDDIVDGSMKDITRNENELKKTNEARIVLLFCNVYVFAKLSHMTGMSVIALLQSQSKHKKALDSCKYLSAEAKGFIENGDDSFLKLLPEKEKQLQKFDTYQAVFSLYQEADNLFRKATVIDEITGKEEISDRLQEYLADLTSGRAQSYNQLRSGLRKLVENEKKENAKWSERWDGGVAGTLEKLYGKDSKDEHTTFSTLKEILSKAIDDAIVAIDKINNTSPTTSSEFAKKVFNDLKWKLPSITTTEQFYNAVWPWIAIKSNNEKKLSSDFLKKLLKVHVAIADKLGKKEIVMDEKALENFRAIYEKLNKIGSAIKKSSSTDKLSESEMVSLEEDVKNEISKIPSELINGWNSFLNSYRMTAYGKEASKLNEKLTSEYLVHAALYSPDVLSALVKKGGPINICLEVENERGDTPLFALCDIKDSKIAKKSLEILLDPEKNVKFYRSPKIRGEKESKEQKVQTATTESFFHRCLESESYLLAQIFLNPLKNKRLKENDLELFRKNDLSTLVNHQKRYEIDEKGRAGEKDLSIITDCELFLKGSTNYLTLLDMRVRLEKDEKEKAIAKKSIAICRIERATRLAIKKNELNVQWIDSSKIMDEASLLRKSNSDAEKNYRKQAQVQEILLRNIDEVDKKLEFELGQISADAQKECISQLEVLRSKLPKNWLVLLEKGNARSSMSGLSSPDSRLSVSSSTFFSGERSSISDLKSPVSPSASSLNSSSDDLAAALDKLEQEIPTQNLPQSTKTLTRLSTLMVQLSGRIAVLSSMSPKEQVEGVQSPTLPPLSTPGVALK